MDQPSAFEVQYPLSPRKFWKKILPNIVAYLLISAIFGALIGVVYTQGFLQNTNIFAEISSFLIPTLVLYIISISIDAIYIKAYIKRYYYDCGEQFVTIKKGVFTPSEIHVQYQKIQDVYVDQDLLDRIMGLYDVHIASATVTSGIEAHIDGVDATAAENIKNYLLGKIKGENTLPNTYQNQTTPESVTFQSTKKVSSTTYPISGSWYFVAIVGAVWFSIFFTLVLSLGFLSVLNNSNLNIDGTWFLLLFVVIFFLRVIWLMIWKKNYYFELTPDYILLKTGVIGKQENHLPYKAIQNVINKQSLVERIFGLATVVVQNAAQISTQNSRGRTTSVGVNISMVGQPKAKAEELNNILNDITSKINPQNSSSMGV